VSPPCFEAVVFDWEGTLAGVPGRGGGAGPWPGIEALLEALHALGVPLAVATGKSRRGLEAALEALGWRSLFAATRTADDGPGKPAPWMLLDLAASLGVAPERLLMIGDTTLDIGMARAAEASAVGVSWGLQQADVLRGAGALAVVDEVAALGDWLWPRLARAREGLEGDRAWHPLCASHELHDGGEGLRFVWRQRRGPRGSVAVDEPAFAIRHEGVVRAYLNRCAHAPVELDWPAGRFFDEAGLYLVCASHGALYRPEDGHCIGGPCRGRGLIPVVAREHGGRVWVARTFSLDDPGS